MHLIMTMATSCITMSAWHWLVMQLRQNVITIIPAVNCTHACSASQGTANTGQHCLQGMLDKAAPVQEMCTNQESGFHSCEGLLVCGLSNNLPLAYKAQRIADRRCLLEALWPPHGHLL